MRVSFAGERKRAGGTIDGCVLLRRATTAAMDEIRFVCWVWFLLFLGFFGGERVGERGADVRSLGAR